jgi:hypothetical protein
VDRTAAGGARFVPTPTNIVRLPGPSDMAAGGGGGGSARGGAGLRRVAQEVVQEVQNSGRSPAGNQADAAVGNEAPGSGAEPHSSGDEGDHSHLSGGPDKLKISGGRVGAAGTNRTPSAPSRPGEGGNRPRAGKGAAAAAGGSSSNSDNSSGSGTPASPPPGGPPPASPADLAWALYPGFW